MNRNEAAYFSRAMITSQDDGKLVEELAWQEEVCLRVKRDHPEQSRFSAKLLHHRGRVAANVCYICSRVHAAHHETRRDEAHLHNNSFLGRDEQLRN